MLLAAVVLLLPYLMAAEVTRLPLSAVTLSLLLAVAVRRSMLSRPSLQPRRARQTGFAAAG